jgi:hypothetical protein
MFVSCVVAQSLLLRWLAQRVVQKLKNVSSTSFGCSFWRPGSSGWYRDDVNRDLMPFMQRRSSADSASRNCLVLVAGLEQERGVARALVEIGKALALAIVVCHSFR